MKAVFRVPNALSYGGDSRNWRKFKQQFDIYMKATGLINNDSENKVNIFLNIAGDEALEIYNNLELEPDERKDYDAVIEGFENYCTSKQNVIYKSFKFFTRVQQSGEFFNDFYNDLKVMATFCNFGDQKDRLIRDRIIAGIRNPNLQETFLKSPDLSLDEVVKMCAEEEAKRIQMGQFKCEENNQDDMEEGVEESNNNYEEIVENVDEEFRVDTVNIPNEVVYNDVASEEEGDGEEKAVMQFEVENEVDEKPSRMNANHKNNVRGPNKTKRKGRVLEKRKKAETIQMKIAEIKKKLNSTIKKEVDSEQMGIRQKSTRSSMRKTEIKSEPQEETEEIEESEEVYEEMEQLPEEVENTEQLYDETEQLSQEVEETEQIFIETEDILEETEETSEEPQYTTMQEVKFIEKPPQVRDLYDFDEEDDYEQETRENCREEIRTENYNENEEEILEEYLPQEEPPRKGKRGRKKGQGAKKDSVKIIKVKRGADIPPLILKTVRKKTLLLGKMPYPCKKCDSSFWTAVQLERHQLVHVLKKVPPPNSSAPKRIFKCEECGKEFKKICDLERHTRVHTGEKPSVCNICNKRFQQAYNLNKHLLIHTQEKNYECIICQKKFGRNDVLNRHVLTHSIDKPFHCSICSKTFIRNTQLNLHIRKHHGSKNDPKNDDSVAAGTSSD